MGLAICGLVDWSATGSMLSGIGTIVGALAVIYAAHKGSQTFKQWRERKNEERRIELAEHVMTLAYKLRRAIEAVRAEGMLPSENAQVHDLLVSTGVINDQTPLERIGKLVTAQAAMSRSNAQKALWDTLLDTMPTAKAIFGDAAETALNEFWQQRNRVVGAADSYAKLALEAPPNTERREAQLDAQRDRLEAIIWLGGGADGVDAVASLVDAAVKSLEDMLLPIIRSDTPFGTKAESLKASQVE